MNNFEKIKQKNIWEMAVALSFIAHPQYTEEFRGDDIVSFQKWLSEEENDTTNTSL